MIWDVWWSYLNARTPCPPKTSNIQQGGPIFIEPPRLHGVDEEDFGHLDKSSRYMAWQGRYEIPHHMEDHHRRKEGRDVVQIAK